MRPVRFEARHLISKAVGALGLFRPEAPPPPALLLPASGCGGPKLFWRHGGFRMGQEEALGGRY